MSWKRSTASGAIDSECIIKVYLVEIAIEHGDVFGIEPGTNLVEVGDAGNLGDYICVVRFGYLRSVAPVRLVAVVLFGIMRRRHHHTRVATQFADRETQLRGGTQGIEKPHLESIGGENICDPFGKQAAVVARIVAHCNSDLLALETPGQVICKALGGHSDGVDIHPVCADSHDASQSARAEFEVAVKALAKLCGVIVQKVSNLPACGLVEVFVEPSLRPFAGKSVQIVCHYQYKLKL